MAASRCPRESMSPATSMTPCSPTAFSTRPPWLPPAATLPWC